MSKSGKKRYSSSRKSNDSKVKISSLNTKRRYSDLSDEEREELKLRVEQSLEEKRRKFASFFPEHSEIEKDKSNPNTSNIKNSKAAATNTKISKVNLGLAGEMEKSLYEQIIRGAPIEYLTKKEIEEFISDLGYTQSQETKTEQDLLESNPTVSKKYISQLLERSLDPVFSELRTPPEKQESLIELLTSRLVMPTEKKEPDSLWQDRVVMPIKTPKKRLSAEEKEKLDQPFKKLDISELNIPKWSNRENRLEKDSPVAFYLRHYDEYLDHADFAKCKLDSADVKNHDPMLYNALKGVERANEGRLPYTTDNGNTAYAAFPSKGERVLALVMKVQQGELEMPSDRLLRQSVHASARRHNVDLPTNEVSRD